jgi:hypothetical protein
MNTTTIKLTPEFQLYFAKIAKENHGSWPSSDAWPACGVGYTVNQFEDGVAIKFDSPVTSVEGQQAKKFRIRPVSGRKPNGEFSALRS